MNDTHEKTQFGREMKKHLEDAVTAYKQEILNLKKTVHEAQNLSQVTKEHVRIVLQTHGQRKPRNSIHIARTSKTRRKRVGAFTNSVTTS